MTPPTTLPVAQRPDVAHAWAEFKAIQTAANEFILGRDQVIEATMVALLSAHHISCSGRPARASRTSWDWIGSCFDGARTGTWLMSRDTTKADLLGPVDIPALLRGEYTIQIEHGLANRHFATLDEFFLAGPAVRQALYRLLNERRVQVGTQEVEVPLMTVLAGTNHLPEDDAHNAQRDRFGIQVYAPYVDRATRRKLLKDAAYEHPQHRLKASWARAAPSRRA
jgi:MoxR-like ATPase